MKIDYLEMCGFRGFRDKVRLELASGFVVITGRNGVGKSTICDAIEFALTGNIDKYRVEKAAQETLSDYLWWRGEGAAPGHYVMAGFSDDQGRKIEMTRSREDGANMTAHEIESALCVAEAKPDEALSQVCRTSIIRDELIAALSLDLTEIERFELVRASLGAIIGSDYGAKAAKMLESAKAAWDQAEKEYELARERLTAAIADLAQARDAVANTGDVQAAMALLDQVVDDAHGDVASRLRAARRFLADRRQRLGALRRELDVGRRAEAELRSFDTSETQADVARRRAEIERLDQSRLEAATLYAAAMEQARTEREQDRMAAALTALVAHGEAIGLHDGNCPLCAAPRTDAEFAAGIAAARARLRQHGAAVAEVQANVEAQRRALEEAEKGLAAMRERTASLEARMTTARERVNAVRALLEEHLLALSPVMPIGDLDDIERQAVKVHGALVNLERAVLTLEASSAVDRVSELEAKVTNMRRETDATAERAALCQRALAATRSINKGVKRTNAEIIDERLSAISPLLNELYQRLRPHANWCTIEYAIRGDVKRFLSLRVGENLNPQFVFSSGQRRAAGLAFLLSVYLSRPWCQWKTLVLDDPVQHIDDYRALHLVEVLAALRQDGRQIICAVEDAALADLLCRRLRSSFESPGRRFDLDAEPKDGSVIRRQADIHPPPNSILRTAAGLAAVG